MNDLLIKLCMDLLSSPLFAEDVADKIKTVITNVISKVKVVATPIAVLCVLFCAIKMMVSSDPKGVQTAKSWMLTIAVALLIIYAAEPLINTLVEAFK